MHINIFYPLDKHGLFAIIKTRLYIVFLYSKEGTAMNEFLRRAKELEHQMQKDRRYLHQHAEAGEHLPGTTKYVMERLSSIGLSPGKSATQASLP